MKSKRQSQSNPIIFPNLGLWSQSFYQLPGTQESYQDLAGPVHLNAVVSIGLRWMNNGFWEAALNAVRGRGKGKGKSIDDHPTLRLLENPNPYYGSAELAAGFVLSDTCDGNTYFYKMRNGYGEVGGLYWLYHRDVTPVSVDNEFISYYQYQPRWGTPVQQFDPQDIIHIRNGIDPWDTRLGFSALKANLRELTADNASSSYTAALVRHMGALSIIVTPIDKETEITPEMAAKLQKKLQHSAGDNAGDPNILSYPVTINQVGLSPEDMALDTLRTFSEDRIASAMGLNSMVLNLTSGSGAKTYANSKEATMAAYDNCLKPLHTRFANAMNTQLLPEMDATGNVRLSWDYCDLQVYQESENDLNDRINTQWENGLIDRYEARSQLGYDVTPADKGVMHRAQSQPQIAPPAAT